MPETRLRNTTFETQITSPGVTQQKSVDMGRLGAEVQSLTFYMPLFTK